MADVTTGDVLRYGTMVPVSAEMAKDIEAFRETRDRVWAAFASDMRWHALGSRNPWPNAGFNPHKRTFPEPEPETCECCGQYLEDCDD